MNTITRMIKGLDACSRLRRATLSMLEWCHAAPGGGRSVRAILVALVLIGLMLLIGPSRAVVAQLAPPALPQVSNPFPGDARLEPIPGFPIHLVNFPVFANGKALLMRFPPRVNGQTQADGDRHADMFILYNALTGKRINQPVIVEAVPKGALGPNVVIPDAVARLFSPIWELHVVLVAPTYNPANPTMLIDSAGKVLTSPLVKAVIQTNLFLNCPVVPVGSTVDPGSPPVEPAFFDGRIVNIVRYDIEDGEFNPQILFKFVDAAGNTLPTPDNPHLVASKAPGDPFYSTIWEVWTVHVPAGQEAAALNMKSGAEIKASGFAIESANIRLDCPVVAVDGVFVPFEDPFAMLTDRLGRFKPTKFPFDVPETAFFKARTFIITALFRPGIGIAPVDTIIANPTGLPIIDPDIKGNVIPLILTDPMLQNCPPVCSSGPNTTGEKIRFEQADLDSAFALAPAGSPCLNAPCLPTAIEQNFTNLINAGLLPPAWGWSPAGAPPTRPYQDRLAVVGRALFELVWQTDQGINQKNVTSCLACHSQSAAGGAARGLYTVLNENPLSSRLNAGSLWGGGGAELLVRQLKTALGEPVDPATGQFLCTGAAIDAGTVHTCAHGSRGQFGTMRSVGIGAINTHVGIQSTEFIISQVQKSGGCGFPAGTPLTFAQAAACDLDGDGVVNEMTTGEMTAIAAFLATRPVPAELAFAPGNVVTEAALSMGITPDSVERGRLLFRHSISGGGLGCAACHTPFNKFLDGTTLVLSNPETGGGAVPVSVATDVADPTMAIATSSPLPRVVAPGIPIAVSFHAALPIDVAEGLADFVGQPGLRNYGDFKRHKLGPLAKVLPTDLDNPKTAELWDVGSSFPFLIGGNFGSNLKGVIQAHQAVALTGIRVTKGRQVNSGTQSSLVVTITNLSGADIVASPDKPIRVVLTKMATPGATAANAAGTVPGGDLGRGALWLITQTIPAGGSATVQVVFDNPSQRLLRSTLAVYDHGGFSEAILQAQAFARLLPPAKTDLINFLRVQLIGGLFGEQ